MRRVLAGAAALALSGCWLQTGYGPTHQSSNPFETGLTAGNVASLAPVWSTPVPNEFGAEPLVDGSSVYTAGFEGVDTFVVTALGRGSGTPLWHHDVPAEPGVPRAALGTLVRAGPDQVLVAGPGAAGGPVILALDPDTGATQATLPVPGLTDPSWVIADDSVIAYLAATDLTSPQPVANIVVRDRATLALRWSSVSPPDIDSLPTPTLISQGRLARLDALAADGAPEWTTVLSDLGGLAVAGDTVYGTDPVARSLVAFDAASGALRWRADAPGVVGHPAVAGGLVYAEATSAAPRSKSSRPAAAASPPARP